MDSLSLSQINAALDAAFQAALAAPQPQRADVHSIGTNATLRTDIYSGAAGSGFLVTATVELGWRTLSIVRQHGPETWRELPSPTLERLVEECQKQRATRYASEASVYDLADAETKLASPEASVQAEGAAQKAAVLARRLEIKSELPKPL